MLKKTTPSALDHLDEIGDIMGHCRLAIFLDYDGTLTPIVRRPEEAVLPSSMREILRALAVKVPVAILSGRDLENLRQRVSIEAIAYAGSHGFDISGPHGVTKQMAMEFIPILDQAEKDLGEKLCRIPGALLERKRFSIAAHYREVDDESVCQVADAVNEVAARHRELRTITGKKVYELQPNIEWNKGKALLWLMEKMARQPRQIVPIYIGDDLTDEDVFRALPKRSIGIVVSEEMLPTAARFMLRTPMEVEQFLRETLARLL